MATEETPDRSARDAAVELYWVPLGAGGHSVRFNGQVYEALTAARSHRERRDLYHAALVVSLDGERYTIEVAPSPDTDEQSRGVVATGAVGSRWAGWLRLFRYEVRCWPGGAIPDLRYAVGEPERLVSDPGVARRMLDLVPTVPTPVWGRDELRTGDMWNSNSVVAWLISTTGLSADSLRPPPHGRAPGWDAGLELARRSASSAAPGERSPMADTNLARSLLVIAAGLVAIALFGPHHHHLRGRRPRARVGAEDALSRRGLVRTGGPGCRGNGDRHVPRR